MLFGFMKPNKNQQRDERIMKRILEYQNEISLGLQRHGVAQAADLSSIDPLIRRGLIQIVGDIFELTKELTDSTLNILALDTSMVKGFRNAIVHNYGSVDNIAAFAFMRYCISKAVKDNTKKVLGELQQINPVSERTTAADSSLSSDSSDEKTD